MGNSLFLPPFDIVSIDFYLCRVGFNVDTSLLPYGDVLRQHRKWAQGFFGSQSAMKRIEDVQEIETRRLVLRLLENPNDIKGHLHASVSSSHCFHVPPAHPFLLEASLALLF